MRRCLCLEVADGIARIMDKLKMSDTAVIRSLKSSEPVIEKCRTFNRQDDMRFARKRPLDVDRRAHDLEFLLGKMPMYSFEFLPEPRCCRATLGGSVLLQTSGRATDPWHVADKRPRYESGAAARHIAPERLSRGWIGTNEEKMCVHVGNRHHVCRTQPGRARKARSHGREHCAAVDQHG